MRQSSVLVVLGDGPESSGELARATRLSGVASVLEIVSERGHRVTLARRSGRAIVFAGGVAIAALRLGDVDETAFDALVVLDGEGICNDLSADAAFARLVRRFDVTPRPLALAGSAIDAIATLRRCDGAPLLRNRRVATCACRAGQLRAWGAEPAIEPEDAEHVSVDTYLVTAQNHGSLRTLARVVGAYLNRGIGRRAARAS